MEETGARLGMLVLAEVALRAESLDIPNDDDAWPSSMPVNLIRDDIVRQSPPRPRVSGSFCRVKILGHGGALECNTPELNHQCPSAVVAIDQVNGPIRNSRPMIGAAQVDVSGKARR